MAGFEAETRQGRAMGFDGKTLIHPDPGGAGQRGVLAIGSAPADARLIVEAFRDPAYANAGVINLDGRMVERLHLAQAQRLLAIDEAIRASTGAVSARAGGQPPPMRGISTTSELAPSASPSAS